MTDGPARPYIVDLQPVGRRIDVSPGTTLLEAARSAGVGIVSICGGLGTCGECRVRCTEGRLSPLTITEEGEFSRTELADGYRLACQAEVLGSVRVDIPPESLASPQRLQVEGREIAVPLDPVVIPLDVEVPAPDLYDLRADLTRLQAAFSSRKPESNLTASLAVSAELPGQLRMWNWKARLVLRDNELVALLPHPVTDDQRRTTDDSSRSAHRSPAPSPQPPAPGLLTTDNRQLTTSSDDLLGLAVDVGTTKLAAYLVDLASGATVAKSGAMNPQIAFGEDVISRIAYSNSHSNGRDVLQRCLIDTLNGMVTDLCSTVGGRVEQVVEAVAVGNTAMQHLFCGLPVTQLGEAPYVPAVGDALQFRASEVGLRLAHGTYIYLPPNIAGYVGGDHVSMLLSAVDEQLLLGGDGPTVVALDIGTNTEISLFHGGRVLSCSCASGPAFEGAHIRDGMRAAPGAVERVRISGDDVQVYTIDGQPATGICGSGILDAVAEMLSSGILDERGAIIMGHARVRPDNGRPALVLVDREQTATRRDLLITRRDVNEIQLAKSAIRSGVEILLAEAGITSGDIDRFIVAGAFGTYLDLKSAMRIGMFPHLPLERFHQVGNAAGVGARALLVSRRQRSLAGDIARRIEYVELTTHPDFAEEYVRAIGLSRPGARGQGLGASRRPTTDDRRPTTDSR
jgi:uncharacterized 2Fe-2S/4Fe-4S cluster protein (DUF4445 family)